MFIVRPRWKTNCDLSMMSLANSYSLMSRFFKWGIVGAYTIILSKGIHYFCQFFLNSKEQSEWAFD